MTSITYAQLKEEDFDSWLQLALKLWPDTTEEELREDLEHVFISNNQNTFLAKNNQQEAVGFINVSVRSDYVEGADSSPTGYLEGIYIEPMFRKQGIAHQLLKLGEQWLAQQGCTQIGSDTWLWNKESQAFHKKLGFHEEEILVHFLKNILK